jgi:hypothetical protein
VGRRNPKSTSFDILAELKTCDTDANGTLSLEEFAAMHAAHTRPTSVRAL